jgi:hypothetical protein
MSASVLKNKKALCIFPEGGRSFDGRLMEFRKGIDEYQYFVEELRKRVISLSKNR